MRDELETGKRMPLHSRVIVLRFDDRGEPWPVAAVDIDQAGRRVFAGDAGRAYEALVAAARKCGARLMDQSLREALLEREGLKEDLEPLRRDDLEPDPEQAGSAVTHPEGRAGVPALPSGAMPAAGDGW